MARVVVTNVGVVQDDGAAMDPPHTWSRSKRRAIDTIHVLLVQVMRRHCGRWGHRVEHFAFVHPKPT
jgi:hypothetical protein